MAKASVRMNYQELQKLKDQILTVGDSAMVDQFLTSCAKELAARLLAKVVKRTPVGSYPNESGKTGGTLRRGWTGGKTSNATAYVNSLNVVRSGEDYVIEIINPTEYASYVEFGHRTANHTGWVEGKFMLSISEQEIRSSAPNILSKKLEKYLKECFT